MKANRTRRNRKREKVWCSKSNRMSHMVHWLKSAFNLPWCFCFPEVLVELSLGGLLLVLFRNIVSNFSRTSRHGCHNELCVYVLMLAFLSLSHFILKVCWYQSLTLYLTLSWSRCDMPVHRSTALFSLSRHHGLQPRISSKVSPHVCSCQSPFVYVDSFSPSSNTHRKEHDEQTYQTVT